MHLVDNRVKVSTTTKQDELFNELQETYKELASYMANMNAGKIFPYETDYIARKLSDFTVKYTEYMLSLLEA